MSSIENKALKDIVDLYSLLRERKDQTPEMLDITDVLLEVSKKLKTTKNPEALINRLVQYIRSTAIKGKIYFPPEEEKNRYKSECHWKKSWFKWIIYGRFFRQDTIL